MNIIKLLQTMKDVVFTIPAPMIMTKNSYYFYTRYVIQRSLIVWMPSPNIIGYRKPAKFINKPILWRGSPKQNMMLKAALLPNLPPMVPKRFMVMMNLATAIKSSTHWAKVTLLHPTRCLIRQANYGNGALIRKIA